MTAEHITVVDTGVANRHSVRNAFEYLGYRVLVTHDPADIVNASRLVFPGVGAFAAGMKTITDRGLTEPLSEAVINRRTPILGICLGFQMMAETSEEGGHEEGLGWIPGQVTKIVPSNGDTKVPHVGFNNISPTGDRILFKGLPNNSDFYFLHSYQMKIDEGYVAATCQYDGMFVAAIEAGNIMGTQFHPEKSQSAGLQLLKNFAEQDFERC